MKASELDARKRGQLLALAELFVTYQQTGHARVKMTEVKAHLDRMHFPWIGGDTDDSVFYYRLHSPVLLIEFDHQRPIALRSLVTDAQPMRDHIHVVVRTSNGERLRQGSAPAALRATAALKMPGAVAAGRGLVGKRVERDRSWRGFNFFLTEDLTVLLALLQGELTINGLGGRRPRAQLTDKTPGQIARILKRLRLVSSARWVARIVTTSPASAGVRWSPREN